MSRPEDGERRAGFHAFREHVGDAPVERDEAPLPLQAERGDVGIRHLAVADEALDRDPSGPRDRRVVGPEAVPAGTSNVGSPDRLRRLGSDG